MSTIDPDFERRWREARALENRGEQRAAKQLYESLIEQDPSRLYVRLRLSAIEQSEGHYRASRAHAVRGAEEVRSGRWKDLAVVTRTLLKFDEWGLVGELIEGTDWSRPEIIRDSPALSQHLWLIGKVPEALRLADAALPHAATNTSLRYSRATILRYLGRIDDATREFEACLALNPHDPYAHWSLANHAKADPLGSRIARVEGAVAAYPGEGIEQPYLHYALFKEFEDAGDVENAWKHLAAGAALKRKQIRYDRHAEEAGFLALRQATEDALPGGARSPVAEDGRVPIFIVGMPRSGTTLLERILGGHSQVMAAGELNAFNGALCLEADQFRGAFLTAGMVDGLRNADFAAVGRRYLADTAAWTKGRHYLIDKNPENFVNAGYIARALPEARIICLRRNPMDACLSNFKNLFSNEAYGYSYDLDELADYYERFDRLCRHWRETLGGQFLEVSYEQLAAEPLVVSERVMAFCGLSFDPGLVDITRNAAPVTTASSSQVRESINTRGIGAWRKYESQLQPLRVRLEAGASAR